MKTQFPTFSQWEFVALCLLSWLLPVRVERLSDAADAGTALHAALARMITSGKDVAVAAAPEQVLETVEAIDEDAVHRIIGNP